MVLQRRLDYGFNGYQVPVVPRASRSARGKGPLRKKCEDKQTRAFDVLASVAGNFLREGESSAPSETTCTIGQHDMVTSSVKWDQEDGEQFCQGHRRNYAFNEILRDCASAGFKGGSASKGFDHSEKICVAEELENISGKNKCVCPFSKVGSKLFGGQGQGVINRNTEGQLLNSMSIDSGTAPAERSLKDEMEIGSNPPAQVTSGSTLKMPFLRDFMALGPFSGHCADVKLVSRDNDENFLGSSRHCTMEKTRRPLLYSVDRRTRNLSPSRDWKVAPNLKVGGHSAGKKTPIHPSGRFCDDHERSQKIFPFKKRKFFDQIPDSLPDACHREEEFNSSTKRHNCGQYHSGALNGTAAFCSAAGQKASSESRDCNVKLSIKSFKVPELFVEIPATATVGSLKRTVMEAVTAILGDGLHVGILIQGKKVRDDSKTLLQTGISQNNKHRTLGFMLEPKHAQIMPPACMQYSPFRFGSVPGRPIRHTASLTMQPGTPRVSAAPPKSDCESCFGSDLNVVPSLADASTDNARALVVVPPISTEAFAVVPFHRKSSHPAEFGQRRIRRPFSVPEVEALVQAVEKLGTGRWRDVKMCAFDNANHRTYVDLKDKWKTLVHTARISPQQRRGEQVPQELLDRVLAAHAYWSQHQVRQQIKAAV